MAKRVAEKELTDRNWDQEEETEEISLCLSDDTETASLSFILSASDGASLMRESSTKVGTFSVASEEVLKNRPIKKAKRRNVVTESEGGGAFKGFKGFVLPSGTGIFSGFGNGPGTKSFGLLSNGGSSSSSITNSSSLSSLKTASETEPTFSSMVSSVSANSVTLEKTSAHLEANGENPERLSSGLAQSKSCNSESYHKQLAALNCSVRDWIVKHVNANPLCDLSPIFHDYEKYLAEIEQQGLAGHSSSGSSGSTKATEGQPRPTFGSSALQQGSAFFFNSSKSEDALGKKRESEKKIELKAAAAFTTLFSLDKSDSSDLSSGAAGSGFSFSPKKGGLFGKEASQAKVAPSFSNNALDAPTESSSHESTGAGEEEEEPPKVVINEVKEEDAFYSKKCKVFYKKDNEFKEKGVGTLHLKPASNQKTQLLIRADTNLGNILLNILVPPNMPCSRTGKNNVLIVCVPNPPIDEKNATVPLPILIRVKTSEDANELHKILLEKKEEV